MRQEPTLRDHINVRIEERPAYLITLAVIAVLGCVVFAGAILIADIAVPHHDWVADTISDLGAGRREYIVDIGIYAFATALLATALMASHAHLGGWEWSGGIIGLMFLALVVFLIGARNEYGDHDNDGATIHIYLVYAVGVIMALVPYLLSHGAARAGREYGQALVGVSVLWIISAPLFFLLPTSIDGIYERYLGLIAFAMVGVMAVLFIRRARVLSYG